MTHLATRNLLALAAIAAMAGCASQAPFELPDLDARSPEEVQAAQPKTYPAYRYGYGPYGWYGYGQSSHGTRQPAGTGTPATPGTPGTAPAPVVVVVEPPRPRPPMVERTPPERPARTTEAADDTRPARRPPEQ